MTCDGSSTLSSCARQSKSSAPLVTLVCAALSLAMALSSRACCAATRESSAAILKALSVEELMNVEVSTVSRFESTVGQSPAAIFVITQDMIRRSGVTNFPELLRLVPGLSVARIDGNKWALSARGFSERFGNKLLVQVDGRTVYNPLFSGVYWDALTYPLADIERIEIVRGPGASVWGANAVNGIIHIISKRAADTQGGLVSSEIGTEDRGLVTLRYGGRLSDATFYRAYASAATRDEQFSRAGDPNDQWREMSSGFRCDSELTEQDRLTIQGDVMVSKAGRKDLRPTPTVPFVLTNVETEATHANNLLARWVHTRPDDSEWSLQVYRDNNQRQGDHGYVDLRWDTSDIDFQHRLPLIAGSHRIAYGLGLRYIDAFLGPSPQDGGFAVSFPPPDRVTKVFSAFVQDQIELVDDTFSVTLGSKLEHNDFTGVEIQPTLRLLWTPSAWQSGWVAVSRAIRTPNLSEDGIGTRQVPSFPAALGGAPLFAQLSGNIRYESEEVIAYEMGYRAQYNSRLALDVALFHNDYDDLRVAVPGSVRPGAVAGTFEIPLGFQNRMQGTTQGVELSVTGQIFEGWKLAGAYSFLEMSLHADPTLPVGTRINAEALEGQSPSQQLLLRSSWDASADLQFEVAGRFVDRLEGFNPAGGVAGGNVIDSYVAVDAHVTFRPRENLQLAVGGQNLLNRRHPETGTAQFLRSSPVQIERALYATAALKW